MAGTRPRQIQRRADYFVLVRQAHHARVQLHPKSRPDRLDQYASPAETLHVYAGFDTVAFDFEGEIRLWDNLSHHVTQRDIPDRLINMRRREWQLLDTEARREIARFFCWMPPHLPKKLPKTTTPSPTLEVMQSEIRQLSGKMQQRLFTLYRFYHDEVGSDSTWMPKAFKQDPFDSELLKHYGIRTGTGATAGALIGLGLDIATLGGSLGLGTAIGGLLGGILPNAQDITDDKINGRQTLHTDPETPTLLAARALDLLHRLANARPCGSVAYRAKERKAPWNAAKLAKRTQQSA